MPLAYLNAGAVSFAAANWSDATGFATNAELAVTLTGQTVSGGLDQSAVTTGINRFLVTSNSTGAIGDSQQGGLKVDIDDVTGDWSSANAGRARLEIFAASGTFYIQAGGASATISNTFMDTGGTVFFSGGTFTTTRITRGTFFVNSSTNTTTMSIWGNASGTLEAKSSSMTTLNMYAGAGGTLANVITARACTTINLYAGVLRYNVTDGSTTTTVNILGGRFIHEAGALTTVNATAGSYEAKLTRAATIGTLNRELSCTVSKNDPLLTITTEVRNNPAITA